MTPEMIASDIKKRWEATTQELARRKRLDPNVFEKVVTALAHFEFKSADADTPSSTGSTTV